MSETSDPCERAAPVSQPLFASGDPQRLTTLMTLFSPVFPIGGFAWSHGLESAIREGRIRDGQTTCDWIAFLLEQGSGWSDAMASPRG